MTSEDQRLDEQRTKVGEYLRAQWERNCLIGSVCADVPDAELRRLADAGGLAKALVLSGDDLRIISTFIGSSMKGVAVGPEWLTASQWVRAEELWRRVQTMVDKTNRETTHGTKLNG